MNNIIVRSIGSGAGKSSVLLGVIGTLGKKGVKCFPYKPIAITAENINKNGLVIPEFLHIISRYMGYEEMQPLFCPLLFVPDNSSIRDEVIDQELYTVYKFGKPHGRMRGLEIPGFVVESSNLVMECYHNISSQALTIIEDIGDYRRLHHLLESTLLNMEELYELFVVRPNEANSIELQGKNCIVTKVGVHSSIKCTGTILGKLPYRTDFENLKFNEHIDKWIEFVGASLEFDKILNAI